MTVIEKSVEKYLKDKVEALGGLCFKFTSGVSGVPDRIVVLDGRCYFIELKRPKGGVVSEKQKYWMEKIKEKGVYAGLLKNKEEIDDFLHRIRP